MQVLILSTLLILIPLDVVVVYLTLRAGQKEYAQSEDESATMNLVMRRFSRYLVLSAVVLICVYLAMTWNVLQSILLGILMSSANMLLIVLIYAVMGSLFSGKIGGGVDE